MEIQGDMTEAENDWEAQRPVIGYVVRLKGTNLYWGPNEWTAKRCERQIYACSAPRATEEVRKWFREIRDRIRTGLHGASYGHQKDIVLVRVRKKGAIKEVFQKDVEDLTQDDLNTMNAFHRALVQRTMGQMPVSSFMYEVASELLTRAYSVQQEAMRKMSSRRQSEVRDGELEVEFANYLQTAGQVIEALAQNGRYEREYDG